MNPSSDRQVIGAIGAYESWARTTDRTARTAPARKAFLDRFEREVDPDRTLDPLERARRAESAKRAYFLRLSRSSVRARQHKAQGAATPARRRAARPSQEADASSASKEAPPPTAGSGARGRTGVGQAGLSREEER